MLAMIMAVRRRAMARGGSTGASVATLALPGAANINGVVSGVELVRESGPPAGSAAEATTIDSGCGRTKRYVNVVDSAMRTVAAIAAAGHDRRRCTFNSPS